MRRLLDSARHGFQRLRVRLIEQRQCTVTVVKSAGKEVPRDASGHVRIAEHFLSERRILMPVESRELTDLDAETAQLRRHMDFNGCVHV